MKTTVSRALLLVLSGTAISTLAFSGVAQAQRRGAPIKYAGQSSFQPSPELLQSQMQATQPQLAQTVNARLNTDGRVEFRYPGEVAASAPSTAVDVAGSVAPSAATSSGKLVLNAAPATKFVGSELAGGALDVGTSLAKPIVKSAMPSAEPAAAPSQPIRIASLQTQRPVSTGKPLTLSRVKVNRDAPVGEERGKASIYTDGFDGAPTANGEIFDEAAMTAAHPSLPLPSLVQVINEDNGREVVVRVNDRGPFDGKRILELSPRAGNVLGMPGQGTANVRVRYLGPAPVKTNAASFASNAVEDESLPPVQTPVVAEPLPTVSVADYGAPAFDTPEPVTPVQASAPLASGNIFIQAGAFADIANAQNLTSALDRGLAVRIEEARVNGSDYFRVLIGPFHSTQAAEVQRNQLSRAGIVDGFLTTR